jgi:hypothetical protein
MMHLVQRALSRENAATTKVVNGAGIPKIQIMKIHLFEENSIYLQVKCYLFVKIIILNK